MHRKIQEYFDKINLLVINFSSQMSLELHCFYFLKCKMSNLVKTADCHAKHSHCTGLRTIGLQILIIDSCWFTMS